MQKLRKLATDYDNFCRECWAFCSVSGRRVDDMHLLLTLHYSANLRKVNPSNTMPTTTGSWQHVGHYSLHFTFLNLEWKPHHAAMTSWNG